MPTVQISAGVDQTLKAAVERYCKSHGIVIHHFIQEALFERLEELEDVEDLKQIRHEPTRPFADVLKERKDRSAGQPCDADQLTDTGGT